MFRNLVKAIAGLPIRKVEHGKVDMSLKPMSFVYPYTCGKALPSDPIGFADFVEQINSRCKEVGLDPNPKYDVYEPFKVGDKVVAHFRHTHDWLRSVHSEPINVTIKSFNPMGNVAYCVDDNGIEWNVHTNNLEKSKESNGANCPQDWIIRRNEKGQIADGVFYWTKDSTWHSDYRQAVRFHSKRCANLLGDELRNKFQPVEVGVVSYNNVATSDGSEFKVGDEVTVRNERLSYNGHDPTETHKIESLTPNKWGSDTGAKLSGLSGFYNVRYLQHAKPTPLFKVGDHVVVDGNKIVIDDHLKKQLLALDESETSEFQVGNYVVFKGEEHTEVNKMEIKEIAERFGKKVALCRGLCPVSSWYSFAILEKFNETNKVIQATNKAVADVQHQHTEGLSYEAAKMELDRMELDLFKKRDITWKREYGILTKDRDYWKTEYEKLQAFVVKQNNVPSKFAQYPPPEPKPDRDGFTEYLTAADIRDGLTGDVNITRVGDYSKHEELPKPVIPANDGWSAFETGETVKYDPNEKITEVINKQGVHFRIGDMARRDLSMMAGYQEIKGFGRGSKGAIVIFHYETHPTEPLTGKTISCLANNAVKEEKPTTTKPNKYGQVFKVGDRVRHFNGKEMGYGFTVETLLPDGRNEVGIKGDGYWLADNVVHENTDITKLVEKQPDNEDKLTTAINERGITFTVGDMVRAKSDYPGWLPIKRFEHIGEQIIAIRTEGDQQIGNFREYRSDIDILEKQPKPDNVDKLVVATNKHNITFHIGDMAKSACHKEYRPILSFGKMAYSTAMAYFGPHEYEHSAPSDYIEVDFLTKQPEKTKTLPIFRPAIGERVQYTSNGKTYRGILRSIENRGKSGPYDNLAYIEVNTEGSLVNIPCPYDKLEREKPPVPHKEQFKIGDTVRDYKGTCCGKICDIYNAGHLAGAERIAVLQAAQETEITNTRYPFPFKELVKLPDNYTTFKVGDRVRFSSCPGVAVWRGTIIGITNGQANIKREGHYAPLHSTDYSGSEGTYNNGVLEYKVGVATGLKRFIADRGNPSWDYDSPVGLERLQHVDETNLAEGETLPSKFKAGDFVNYAKGALSGTIWKIGGETVDIMLGSGSHAFVNIDLLEHEKSSTFGVGDKVRIIRGNRKGCIGDITEIAPSTNGNRQRDVLYVRSLSFGEGNPGLSFFASDVEHYDEEVPKELRGFKVGDEFLVNGMRRGKITKLLPPNHVRVSLTENIAYERRI